MAKEIERIDLDQVEAIARLPPAPVLLVASGDKEEEWNVTTVGMFNVFSMFPVVVGIGVKTSRNIYRLISDSDDFTINVPRQDMVGAVETCGSEAGAKKNKFKEAGLTPVKGLRVNSPVIKECWLNMECKKLSSSSSKRHAEAVGKVHPGEIDIGDHTWFLGQIVHTEIWTDYDRGKSLLYWDGEYRLASKIVKGKEG
jgi:flavin reductase (DIM6/NTAB) family NADH-FMN oxidoreductase RutF